MRRTFSDQLKADHVSIVHFTLPLLFYRNYRSETKSSAIRCIRKRNLRNGLKNVEILHSLKTPKVKEPLCLNKVGEEKDREKKGQVPHFEVQKVLQSHSTPTTELFRN